MQSPNILGVGKNPPHPRNFTRRSLARILRIPLGFLRLPRIFPRGTVFWRRLPLTREQEKEIVAAAVVWRGVGRHRHRVEEVIHRSTHCT